MATATIFGLQKSIHSSYR